MPVALDKPRGHAQIGRIAYATDTAAKEKVIARAVSGARGDPVTQEELRELRRDIWDLRRDIWFAEFERKFATKADIAVLTSELTTRIVVSQVATAAVLFMLLKFA